MACEFFAFRTAQKLGGWLRFRQFWDEIDHDEPNPFFQNFRAAEIIFARPQNFRYDRTPSRTRAQACKPDSTISLWNITAVSESYGLRSESIGRPQSGRPQRVVGDGHFLGYGTLQISQFVGYKTFRSQSRSQSQSQSQTTSCQKI